MSILYMKLGLMKKSTHVYSLDGYNSFRKDRFNRKCRGVCIYITDSVTCEIIWPIVDSHPIIEIIALKCKFCCHTYFILACYHPLRPFYSTDHLSEVTDSIFNLIFSYNEDSILLLLSLRVTCMLLVPINFVTNMDSFS
jgi:hypothetical protein